MKDGWFGSRGVARADGLIKICSGWYASGGELQVARFDSGGGVAEA